MAGWGPAGSTATSPPAPTAGWGPVGSRPAQPTQPTTITGQGARGVVDTITGALGQVYRAVNPGEEMLAQASNATDRIADLFQRAFSNDGGATSPPPPPPVDPITSAVRESRSITARPTVLSEAIANSPIGQWLAVQPQDVQQRWARTVGQFAPGLLFGPEADASVAAQVATRLANVAVPSTAAEAAGEAVRAAGGTPEQEEAARTAAGAIGATAVGVHTAGAAARSARQTRRLGFYDEPPPDEPPPSPPPGPTRGPAGPLGQAAEAFSAALSEGAARKQAARRVAQLPEAPGDVSDLHGAVRQHIEDIDTATQAAVDEATRKAQAATEAAGGAAPADETGAALRDMITTAERAARERESQLWNAVDPDGTLTGNAQATKAGAAQIRAEQPATAAPLPAEPAAILETAENLPDVVPLRDLVALRQRVNAAASNELRYAGRTPTYAVLSRLRGAIADNLANTVGDAIETHLAAAQTPEEIAGAQSLRTAVNDFYARRAQARAVVGQDTFGAPGNGSPGIAGASGTEVPPGGEPNPSARSPSVPGQPSVDPGYADRLGAANAGTAERARTFGIQPITQLTRTTGYQGQFRLPDGRVPEAVWKPGPTGAVNVTAVLRASPDAVGLIEDAAAQSLRKAAMRSDGSIDPAKFARWRQVHDPALNALPDQQALQHFSDAASAGRAVDEAAAGRAAAIKEANAGTLGKILKADTPEEVGQIVANLFNKENTVASVRDLLAKIGNNPQALAGLKRAVADHIGKLATENGGKALLPFARKNAGALRLILSKEELENVFGLGAELSSAAKVGHIESMFSVLGTLLGGATGHSLEAALGGGGGGFAVARVIGMLRQRGIDRVNDLVAEAVANPELGRALRAKAPDHRAGTTAKDVGLVARARAIQRALVAGAAAEAANTDNR